MSITLDGTAGMTAPVGAVYNGLQTGAVVSVSGTSILFTGVPLWAKRITVMISAVAKSTGSDFLIQLGSGTLQTSGYVAASNGSGGTSNNNSSYTSGFGVLVLNGTNAWYSVAVLTLVDASTNTWLMAANSNGSTGYSVSSGGVTITAGTVDRVNITSVSGTSTFNSGKINIFYE